MRPLDITFHFDAPSLRVILADILFRAIDLFTATAIAVMIMALIAIPIAIIVWLLKLALPLIHFC